MKFLACFLISILFGIASSSSQSLQMSSLHESATIASHLPLQVRNGRSSILQLQKLKSPALTNAAPFGQNSATNKDLLSQIHIGMALQHVLVFSPLSYPYKPNNSGQLSLGLNYWHGYLKVNLSYASLEKFGDYPDCEMLDYGLSYEFHQPIYRQLTVFVAPQFGFNSIKFEYSDYSEGRLIETETSKMFALGLQNIWRDRLGISIAYRFYHVLSTPRARYQTLDFGVSYFFKPSKNVRRWLS